MSVELLGVKVNNVGIPVLPIDDDKAGRTAFFKLFWETAVGRRFQPICTEDNQALLGEYIERKYPGDQELTLPEFEEIVTLLLDTHTFPEQQPTAPATVVEDARPRNAQGRFLSEFETWASDPHRSMKEIRERARVDSAFGAWFRNQVSAETLQDGGLRVIGGREPSSDDRAIPELTAWVNAYRTLPVAEIKRRCRADTNPAGHIQWNKMLNLAMANNLI